MPSQRDECAYNEAKGLHIDQFAKSYFAFQTELGILPFFAEHRKKGPKVLARTLQVPSRSRSLTVPTYSMAFSRPLPI